MASDENSISINKFLILFLVVASFIIGALVTKVSYLEKKLTDQKTSSEKPNQVLGQKTNVALGHLPVLGDKNAKITIVEFADFRCPFCKQWFTEIGKNLIKDYVDTGKATLTFRHFAFLGQPSIWAAEASECANEQGKFWDYHDYLYDNQAPESDLEYYSKDNLIKYAGILGLATNQFSSCLTSDKYAKQVADDLADGEKIGVSGTPTAFINGEEIVGSQPYSTFKSLIEEELSK